MSRLDTRTGAHYAPPPQKQGSVYSDAMRSVVDHQAVNSLHYLKRLRWDTTGSCDEIISFADALCRDASRRGVPLVVSDGWSDTSEPAHVCGMAVDVVHLLRGRDLSPEEWQIVAQIGREVARKLHLKMVWGFDDAACGRDPAHWELADWRSRRDPREPF